MILPLGLYPPGTDLSSFIIIDRVTGQSVSGAGYIVSQPAINVAQFNGFQPQDDPGHDGTDSTNGPVRRPGFYEVVKMGPTL